MLLFATALVTSLATPGGWRLTLDALTLGSLGQTSSSSLARLRLLGCEVPPVGIAAPCTLPGGAASLDPVFGRQALVWRTDFSALSHPDEPGDALGAAQAGFLHMDLLDARHFGAGPEVSWATPDAPHEHLLRQWQFTPGIGVWYSALPSRVFLGISANTWVSTLGETWFLNALSSEARVGFAL